MDKRWTLKKEADQKAVNLLSKQLNNLQIPLCNLLVQRGIDSFDKAKSYFRPSLNDIHDPFLMKDMEKAVKRLEQAIQQEEDILIFGDYDVDGTTSVALVYSFLSQIYSNIRFYIPDRYVEGYGISTQGIDFAEENEISLIIALDCGIKAIDKIDYANKKKIDFIICDHHLPGETLPKAHAVLDPKQKDCPYPFKELSGCGVGFKLMQAFSIKNNIPKERLYNYLDILAVSICADIVPIVGENRILTHFGLKKLNENPQAGFKAMLEIAIVKKKELTVTDVVFTLAPRINAAGRIESGNKAVEVMLSKNPELALESGNYINSQNNDRRTFDQSITKEALAMIESDDRLIHKKTTVLFKEDWHKGVIGIVASRCIESYYRPTIILTESNGKATGSARSVKDFNVYEALEECSDLLEQFGGHKYAAGMTMKKENVKAFQEKFEEVVASTIPKELLIPEIEIDAQLNLDSIDMKFNQILKQFGPFGPENMSPLFLTKNVIEKGGARIVGSSHLKLEIVDPTKPEYYYPAIGFNLGEKLSLIKDQKPFDIVYSVEENEWNGKVSLQLNIKDIRSPLE